MIADGSCAVSSNGTRRCRRRSRSPDAPYPPIPYVARIDVKSGGSPAPTMRPSGEVRRRPSTAAISPAQEPPFPPSGERRPRLDTGLRNGSIVPAVHADREEEDRRPACPRDRSCGVLNTRRLTRDHQTLPRADGPRCDFGRMPNSRWPPKPYRDLPPMMPDRYRPLVQHLHEKTEKSMSDSLPRSVARMPGWKEGSTHRHGRRPRALGAPIRTSPSSGVSPITGLVAPARCPAVS